MKKFLKSIVEKIPYCIGKNFVFIPFSVRLGKEYAKNLNLIKKLNKDKKEEDIFILKGLNEIFNYAKDNFACYRNLYKQAGVFDLKIKTFDDFKKLPITNKEFFKNNISEFSGAYKLNTGGTTGTPFMFYMDKNCWAREWAYMHTIWNSVGYDYRISKLTLRGKNIGNKSYVYNTVHNEFVLNTYKQFNDLKKDVISLMTKHNIKFMHGYPSTIYNFICEAENNCSKEELSILFGNIKGLLLSSEYPHEYMINKFNEHNLKFVSWYGHSEMCILAYNKGNFTNIYEPFGSYGYCEVDNNRLIGTSYRNFDMPLIRYDTGDLVSIVEKSNLGRCLKFAIKEGRSADFVLDKNNNKISLTSLIFGRHHKIFEYAKFVQVSQEIPGKITLYVVFSKNTDKPLEEMFDMTNILMQCEYKIIDKPILTKSGKFKLKI